ncbi:MAG: hypothetical protein C7B45_10565 [Sulfobacillus acidophilus]|uniref:Uncharacterized protein n=1 Tax=Sulfobacillus acidophilus TaxID=53633 RepID=A0A2T2WGV1_9FIRM|nr:MAG: hypothetical protein C7B45_10565 [Sulfobacillus acidophilus]
MASLWDEVGAAVHKTPHQVEIEALHAWISHELAETDREIISYVRKYRVVHPEQIEQAIRDGRLDGHPAWEDMIDWMNLIAYREQLLTLQTNLASETKP